MTSTRGHRSKASKFKWVLKARHHQGDIGNQDVCASNGSLRPKTIKGSSETKKMRLHTGLSNITSTRGHPKQKKPNCFKRAV
eukprot:732859-Karenia_brevis.AAC.1